MIFHVSNLKTRVLDPPTHSYQFDTNCGKIRYVTKWPLEKTNRPSFFLIFKLSHALDGLFSVLSWLHGWKHKCAFCWMKDHWTRLLSDLVALNLFFLILAWNPLFIFRYSCCDEHFPCFGKYIFPKLPTCSHDCTEGSCSSNIPSNF